MKGSVYIYPKNAAVYTAITVYVATDFIKFKILYQFSFTHIFNNITEDFNYFVQILLFKTLQPTLEAKS